MKKIYVEKRNKTLEPMDANKFHQHIERAVIGYPTVSVSDIAMNASIEIVNGTKSEDIQKILIETTSKMILDNPDANIPAARLLNQDLRKKVYNDYKPKSLYETIIDNIENKLYDKDYLFKYYTHDELKYFNEIIDYDRDDNFTYSGLKKTINSYALKKNNKIYETPQIIFMVMSLYIFAKYKEKYNNETRIQWVTELYNSLSNFEISFPTPILSQLRTIVRKFLSCVTIPYGDSKEAVANATRAVYIVVAGGAGLGGGMADLRGLGADIRDGMLKHTGNFQIIKATEKNTKAFTQPTRDGSITSFYPFFSIEIERYLVLGNAKGTDDTRIRDMDHTIMFNDFFFERYALGKDITLFFMNDIMDIMSHIGDYHKFKEMYEKAEREIPLERQTKISSKVIYDTFISERNLQAREYEYFADNVFKHSMWRVPIKQSNLCLEILVPTYPIHDSISIKRNIIFNNPKDEETYYKLRREAYFHQIGTDECNKLLIEMTKCYTFKNTSLIAEVDESEIYDFFTLDGKPNLAEIGVCILSGINIGKVTKERIPVVSELLVRALDELIDYMVYDLPEMEKAAKMRRTLGIGFSDVFHDLAKENVKYNTQEGRQFLHDKIELYAYYLTKASIQLAKDFGPCILFRDTKYSQGLFPKDTYNKNVDELVKHNNQKLDWDSLKLDSLKYGMRHSTLMANAPFGNSSLVCNAQPGIEPPRQLVGKKAGYPIVVPGYEEYGQNYTTVWSDEFNNIDYFKTIAVMQKFIDQTVSTNQYHDLTKYKDNKVKKSLLIEETLVARYYGLPTLYYINFKSKKKKEDGDLDLILKKYDLDDKSDDDDELQIGCSGGSCSI